MATDIVDVMSNLPEDRPVSFRLLSDEEQAVRGRYFLMVYAMGTSVEYAWFHAMSDEAQHSREMKAIVADTTDAEIADALRLRNEPGRPVLDWTPTT